MKESEIRNLRGQQAQQLDNITKLFDIKRNGIGRSSWQNRLIFGVYQGS